MLQGFSDAGFQVVQSPDTANNPLQIEWHVDGQVHRFRLWAFDITHGGGGAEVRAADEFRIQITNGPDSRRDLDREGAIDLLIGYSRDRDAIVHMTDVGSSIGFRRLPGVIERRLRSKLGRQTSRQDMTMVSTTSRRRCFRDRSIVTMNPALLPTTC